MTDIKCSTIYYICVWLIIILIGSLILLKIKKSQELFLERKTCSSGAIYGIQEMFNNTEEAVELLGQIHRDMISFTRKLVKKYCNGSFNNNSNGNSNGNNNNTNNNGITGTLSSILSSFSLTGRSTSTGTNVGEDRDNPISMTYNNTNGNRNTNVSNSKDENKDCQIM